MEITQPVTWETMSTEQKIATMRATDGDSDNLLVHYYFTKGKDFTSEQLAYVKERKEDYKVMAEGLNMGFPVLFCINQHGPKITYKQGSYYNKNISMRKGPGDVAKGTFKKDA